MGNFFKRSVNEFICVAKDTVNKRFVLLLLLVACYAIGLILGFVLKPTEFIFNYFCANAQNYYSVVMFPSSSCLGIFLNRLLSNLGYYIIFFVLALAPALIPANMLIIVYRGFVAGCTIVIFSGLFGLTGILLSCFLILPQNLITTLTLILYTAMPLKKSKNKINVFLMFGLFLYIVSLIGALLEIIILCLLLRPMNFYF